MNILQLVPRLNYGGVETYVIRLSTALKKRGHRVVIASGGGPLKDHCVNAGIPHVTIRMGGLRSITSLDQVVRLCDMREIDIINAHNWSAGALGYLAARWAKIPFVLTIHGLRRPPQRLLAFYWSRRVIAVSKRSREHLVSHFGLRPGQVVESSIGVDTNLFMPAGPPPALRGALGLNPDSPLIAHVTRLSHSKYRVSLSLIEAGPALEKACPGFQTLIVGDGPCERLVARQAERMNRQMGRRAFVFAGARTDIPDILNASVAVVGTATVALEAMACAKPVVGAGKAGFVGIIQPDNFDSAASVCFGDHAESGELHPTTTEGLAAALKALLSDADRARRIGQFGRDQILKAFTAGHVAAHVESIYRQVITPRKWNRIVLFHLNQIGDLLFCLPALRALRANFPSAKIVSVARPYLAGLLRASPYVDEIVHRPTVVDLLQLTQLLLRLRRLQPDLALNFSSSTASILLAWLCGAKERIGFVDAALGRLLTRRVQARGLPNPSKVARLAEAAGASVSAKSYENLLHIPDEDFEYARALLRRNGLTGEDRIAALAPGASGRRRYKVWTTTRFAQTGQGLWDEYGMKVIIVGSRSDYDQGESIRAQMKAPAVNLAGLTSTGQLAALLKQCSLAVAVDSGPMHVAAAMGTPVVALFGPTDPELTGPHGEQHVVVRGAPRPARGTMQRITPQAVLSAVGKIMSASRQPDLVA